MTTITVVGSGPSGVHFAQSALEKGHRVRLVDVGIKGPQPVLPDASLVQLKHRLEDPTAYFLGEDYQGVVYPDLDGEYYGFPPNKAYIFESIRGFTEKSEGFSPLFSFAQGGLAQAWTGGSYPFNDAELADYPFGYEELGPYYDLIARRIGISGESDDLAPFVPVHGGLQTPLRMDGHSAQLLERYQKKRARLQERLGFHMGRSRVAVLSQEGFAEGRNGCRYLGRCLWGCPQGAIYVPAQTLNTLRGHPNFEYLDGRYVTHFAFREGRVEQLCIDRSDGSGPETLPVEALVLAAGTLQSSRILLESLYRADGSRPSLPGLMDNRQILVPFVNLTRIGRRFEPDTYQYNQLALGLTAEDPSHYVHCLVTALKTALYHPIVENTPMDLKTGLFVFRNVHAALGLINVNLHDTRRSDCTVSLEPGSEGEPAQLRIRYTPPADEPARVAETMGRLRRALFQLGCVLPPGMAHERPMGASVHYAGTVPMANGSDPLSCDADCRNRSLRNLWFADGTTYPFLPAKNLTFTLMANAARVADAID